MEFLVIFGLFLIGAINAAQNTSNPLCTPTRTNSTYDDTLVVFVLNHNRAAVDRNKMRYIFKQFVCEIPIADHIKTSLLYYGTDNTETFTDSDFMDSAKIVDKLNATVYNENEPREKKLCIRLKKHLKDFENNSFVQKHANIHYVVLLDALKDLCRDLDIHSMNTSIIFYDVTNSFEILADNRILEIDTSNETSKPLEAIAKDIVSRILPTKTSPILEAVKPKVENSNWLAWGLLAIVICLVCGIFGVWIYYFLLARNNRKKIKAKEKMKKAQKPPPPIAPKPPPTNAPKPSPSTKPDDEEETPHDSDYDENGNYIKDRKKKK